MSVINFIFPPTAIDTCRAATGFASVMDTDVMKERTSQAEKGHGAGLQWLGKPNKKGDSRGGGDRNLWIVKSARERK